MSNEQRPFVPKTAIDFQKLKLERLMANPDKPVIIPELPKEKKGFSVPEFVRNVMGSSAGAGSGEFHVYRHLRRKEYTRQKAIEEKAEKERLDEEFQKKLEENKRIIEEKTAKKRAKRLKRKEKLKNIRCKKVKKAEIDSQEKKSESEEDTSDEENSNSEHEESNNPLDSTESDPTNSSEVLPEKENDKDKEKLEELCKQVVPGELSNPEEMKGNFLL